MRSRHTIFTFHTTHHALWAEELAMEQRIPAEVIPSPPRAGARCDLAIETLPEDVARLQEVLQANGVEYVLFAQER